MTGKILKRFCIWLTAVVWIIPAGITGCGRADNVPKLPDYGETEEETVEAVNYLDNLLHIDLTGMVIPEEADYPGEDRAFLRFQIAKDRLADVQDLLDKTCGKLEVEQGDLPGYRDHAIAKKLKSEELTGAWSFFVSGKGKKKTRSMELYITRDQEGVSYLSFFG